MLACFINITTHQHFVVFDKNDRELLMRPYYSEVVGFNGIKAHRKMKSFKELFARKG